MSVWTERPTAGDMPGHGNRSVEQEELYDRVQASFSGYHLYRPQDTARANTTTYATDEYLVTPVEVPANSVWAVDMRLMYMASTTADFKYRFVAIASATYNAFRFIYANAAGTTSSGPTGAQGGVTGLEGTGGTNERYVDVTGTIFIGATPAKIALEWAQDTVDAVTGTTLRMGSRLMLSRLA